MNSKPLVTVLMPVFNAELYIYEAIESILKQTFTDFEFLIINDGSTDKSLSIIESFVDKRIKLINNIENIRLIDTLNKGIELAQGKYIARMDADDISLPERLERQVMFMEKHAEIGLSGTYIRTIGLEKNYDVHFHIIHEEIKFKLFFDTHFPHPAAIIRTSVFKDNNLKFDKAYLHAEDFALWNAMAEITQLAVIPEILVLKRTHKDQISFKFTDIQHTISSKIRIKLMEKMGLSPTNLQIIIYDKFLFKAYPTNKEDLFVLLDFFNLLIASNRNTKVYNLVLFEKYFSTQYWDLCCINTKYGLSLYKKLQKSHVSAILNLSFGLRIKFFIKTLFKYGK